MTERRGKIITFRLVSFNCGLIHSESMIVFFGGEASVFIAGITSFNAMQLRECFFLLHTTVTIL